MFYFEFMISDCRTAKKILNIPAFTLFIYVYIAKTVLLFFIFFFKKIILSNLLRKTRDHHSSPIVCETFVFVFSSALK